MSNTHTTEAISDLSLSSLGVLFYYYFVVCLLAARTAAVRADNPPQNFLSLAGHASASGVTPIRIYACVRPAAIQRGWLRSDSPKKQIPLGKSHTPETRIPGMRKQRFLPFLGKIWDQLFLDPQLLTNNERRGSNMELNKQSL